MLFDNLKNKDCYREMKDVYTALCFLAELDAPLNETVEIRGKELFANPVSLVSKPEADCVFEAHRKYADIHYILSGTEGIAVRELGGLIPKETFQTEKDIGFYEGEASGVLYLHPGDFMVCWPQDAHKVAIMDGTPGAIQKIVVKVQI